MPITRVCDRRVSSTNARAGKARICRPTQRGFLKTPTSAQLVQKPRGRPGSTPAALRFVMRIQVPLGSILDVPPVKASPGDCPVPLVNASLRSPGQELAAQVDAAVRARLRLFVHRPRADCAPAFQAAPPFVTRAQVLGRLSWRGLSACSASPRIVLVQR